MTWTRICQVLLRGMMVLGLVPLTNCYRLIRSDRGKRAQSQHGYCWQVVGRVPTMRPGAPAPNHVYCSGSDLNVLSEAWSLTGTVFPCVLSESLCNNGFLLSFFVLCVHKGIELLLKTWI